MCDSSSLTKNSSTKPKLLTQYSSISKAITQGSSCYAISSQWWTTFQSAISIQDIDSETLIRNVGSINNPPLLDLSIIYRELLDIPENAELPEYFDGQILAEMSDWDNMSIKPNLKYKTDFVIISGLLWKFLQEHFQGGPEIELIPERKPENKVSNMITYQDECNMEKNIAVNMNLIKVHVENGEDYTPAVTKCISPTATVQSFLNCICRDYGLPSNKSVLQRKLNDKLVELSNKSATLESLGIQNGCFLRVSKETEEEDSFGYNSILNDQESVRETEGPIENLNNHSTFMQDSDYERTFSTHSRAATGTGRLSTGSTNANLEPLDFLEDMLDDDLPNRNGYYNNNEHMEMRDFRFGGMSSHRRNSSKTDVPDLRVADQSYPSLEAFLQRSHQSSGKQKIKLEFKSLKEIQASLGYMQHEWNVWTKSNLNKKG